MIGINVPFILTDLFYVYIIGLQSSYKKFLCIQHGTFNLMNYALLFSIVLSFSMSLHKHGLLFKDIIKWRTVLFWCIINQTRRNLYCTLHTCSFLCKKIMVNALGWFLCMVFFLKAQISDVSWSAAVLKDVGKMEKNKTIQRRWQTPNYYGR